MERDPYAHITRLTDVLGILEDSRTGVSEREIALCLGLRLEEAARIVRDLREVFDDIECESRGGVDYFRIPGQDGTGAPEVAPEVERLRFGMFPRLDGRNLDSPHAN